MEVLCIYPWPRAIMHVDADAFFASCEQALKPHLKGKPVVVGRERGIVVALSYEAKAKGIQRGMLINTAKKLCPELEVLPLDYETYSLFSVRIFEILRRYSPQVEEYSIDEAFVDLTGLRRLYRSSYENIAEKIKRDIERELGISISVGLSITKVLAKIASKYQKPGGFTCIPGNEIHLYLKDLPLEEIWGIGPNTSALLKKFGIETALQFAKKDEYFIKKYLKPFLEIWKELNGISVYPVISTSKSSYKSISKACTFEPTNDESIIFAHLMKNLEEACFKARRFKLAPRRIIFFLKGQDFKAEAMDIKLLTPSAIPFFLAPLIRKGFEKIYNPNRIYRQTGIILTDFIDDQNIQLTLFEDPKKLIKMERLYSAVETIIKKYGSQSIYISSSSLVRKNKEKKLKFPLMDIRV